MAGARPPPLASTAMTRRGAGQRAGLVVLYVAWGATYPVMRVALRTLPPFTLLTWRCLLGALPLVALARWRGEPWPDRRGWTSALAVGALVLVGGHGLTTYGVEHATGGLAALLVSMVSVWLVVLGWASRGERPRSRTLVGLVLGLGGLALIVGTTGRGLAPATVAALLVSPAAWAAGSVLATRTRLPAGPLMSTAAQLLVTVPVFALLSLVAGEPARWPAHWLSGEVVWSVLFLAFVGYTVGFAVYTWLLRELPFSALGTYAYVNPLIAVGLGAWLLHEPVTGHMLLGGALILTGVALVVTTAARQVRPPAYPAGSAAAAPASLELPARPPAGQPAS